MSKSERINSSMIHKLDAVPSSNGVAEEKNNGIKFGIVSPFRESDKGGELVHLPLDKPISYAVETVCKIWGFPNPSDYALKFSEQPGHYVTEERRTELSGKLVSMHHSPAKMCEEVICKLSGGCSVQEVAEVMRTFVKIAGDPTVADTFVGKNGLPVLLTYVETSGQDWGREKAALLALQSALEVLLDIMMLSGEATWDKLQPGVIASVLNYVNQQSPPQLLRPALQVLENAITFGSPAAFSQVDKGLTLPILVKHIETSDSNLAVQQNALALLNAFMTKCDGMKRKSFTQTLWSRKYREIILQHVINKKSAERPTETSHELYVMQTLMLNLLDVKRQTPVDPVPDQDTLHKIKELFRIAFESDSTGNYTTLNFDSGSTLITKREKPSAKRDYQKLGFTNDSCPELDFATVPPGILALDCMYHLANVHTDNYNKIVLEGICRNVGDECPFARSSIALTNVLCELLKIGEPPEEQQGTFYPFFFQHEKPFEELFCVCSQTVTKTWKEMRATVEDFDKVFDVVRDQILRTLRKVPESFEDVRKYLNTFSYAEIKKLREQERCSREEWELQAKPIQELKKKLEPEMKELIKQNRINYLISGTRFNRFTTKGLVKVKEKFWFCRLSQNGKVFHYGECEEKATPLAEELPSKVNVADIKDLYIGKDCPHMKDSKAAKKMSLAFSIVTEKESLQTIDFVAPDKRAFDLWTDGINALLGKPMISDEANKDLEILLHMELKLRLLEIEGLPELPQEAPPIPELPTNFDFSALQINGK